MTGWITMPSITLKQISCGSATHIWGITPEGKLYQFFDGNWNPIDGPEGLPLKWVSVGNDGTVWAINENDFIFRRDIDRWTTIAGRLSQISAGSASEIWGVTRAGGIFRRDVDRWTSIAGTLSQISVGSDGAVWGVTSAGGIFRRDANTWTRIGGALSQISVGSASEVWGLTDAGGVFRRDVDKWTPLVGSLSQISVGSDGAVWGVKNNQVWCYIKECLLIVSDPHLKEMRLEQGDIAKYGFSVINLSSGVIVENLRLELIYNKDDFDAKHVTISPSPPDQIVVPGQLVTGNPVEVEFTITAEQDAVVDSYEFIGIRAYYNVITGDQPESLPIKNNKEGCLPFEVVTD